MKSLIFLSIVLLIFGQRIENSYIRPQAVTADLAYGGARNEFNFGPLRNLQLDPLPPFGIVMHYTTDSLHDETDWVFPGQEFEAGFDTWEGEDRLVLNFEITHLNGIFGYLETDEDEVRCLVCLNVDENSEVRNGDKGFAACYNYIAGNFKDQETGIIQTAGNQWVFLGEVKATNGGNNVKETGKNGFEEDFTWNKNKHDANGFGCYEVAEEEYVEGEVWYVQAQHDSYEIQDYVTLVSKKGFKETGLNNGENHLKCFYHAGKTGNSN